MFETVVPELSTRKSRLLMVETLPLSIALHVGTAAVASLVVFNYVKFPDQPPAVMTPYSVALLQVPAAPPPPPAAAAPTPPPSAEIPHEIVAPTVIPNRIIAPSMLKPTDPAPLVQGVAGGMEEGGVPGGMLGGTNGGVEGGFVGDGVLQPSDQPRVFLPRTEVLPLTVLDRPYPKYPKELQKAKKQGSVTIRYIIDVHGRVREVTILEPDPEQAFNDSTLDAVRQWRFRPFIKDGQRTEVVHELVVLFELRPVAAR